MRKNKNKAVRLCDVLNLFDFGMEVEIRGCDDCVDYRGIIVDIPWVYYNLPFLQDEGNGSIYLSGEEDKEPCVIFYLDLEEMP